MLTLIKFSNIVQNRFCEHLPSESFTSSSLVKSTLCSQPCDTILTFGGMNTKKKNLSHDDGRHVYQYIPSKNRWTFVSFMPCSRQYHSAVLFQSRVFIAGGTVVSQNRKVCCLDFKFFLVSLIYSQIISQITTNSMVSFDIATLSWFKETDMPVKIKNFGFVSAHLQIYAIGGEDTNDTPSNLVFRYDPVYTTWNEVQRMHFKRSRAAVTVHKSHIWVAGGLSTAGIIDSVEYFNPITGIWTDVEISLRVPRCFARMCSTDGKLFIVGGMSQEGCSLASIDTCDEISKTWKQIEELEVSRLFIFFPFPLKNLKII